MSFNKVIVVGNLGRDPELRYTPQGTPACTFSMATNERRKAAGGEQQDVTTWFRVTLWGRQAETAAQYLTKGRSVYVEGRLRVEEWTDKEGKTRHSLEVNASDVQFLDNGSGRNGEGAARAFDNSREPARKASAARPAAELEDEDIPF